MTNPADTLIHQISSLVQKSLGLTDREITNALRGRSAAQQPINQTARMLEGQGILKRSLRHDGKIGNYPNGVETTAARQSVKEKEYDPIVLSEDSLKAHLEQWLKKQDWTVVVMWGRDRGIDIEADRGKEKWIIEVKGIGKSDQVRGNYFIGMLGETLQRMADPGAKYSIALPDIQRYQRLWARLPALAKERTKISMLFVDAKGNVREET